MKPFRIPHLRLAALAAAAATILSAGLVGAQLGDPRGPGEAVPQPPAMCAQTISCTYDERTFLPHGYRFQSLTVCGANCTTQYWVSDSTDNKLLLTVEPVRGGGVVAVGRVDSPTGAHPPVRVIIPHYAPTDAACCPSGYQDTTYTWDAARQTLVAGTPTITPSAEFPGWDNLRRSLEGQQFFEVWPAGS